MGDIIKLSPNEIWNYFDKITQIPRASGKENLIREFILEFAQSHKLEYQTDSVGNIVIQKKGTPGFENKPVIILQSHLDIVCEKNSTSQHDFDKNPIETFIEKGWVKAKSTTLGADNGIGIAAQLAVLAAKDLEHNPLECLFTVEEETGLIGAFGLEKNMLKGKYLINLDSEDDGEIFIGCAGGIDTKVKYPYHKRSLKHDFISYEIKISGLKGGHSGDDIHKGLGNAIKLLTRFLYEANEKFNIRISNFKGGNLSNAIPREAKALISVKLKHEEKFLYYFNEFTSKVRNEYKNTDPGIIMNFETKPNPGKVIAKKDFNLLLSAIHACPNGVIEMSAEMKSLVETSSNLASIKTGANNIEVILSHRSAIGSRKDEIKSRIAAIFYTIGATVIHQKEYPGWQPDKNSTIVKTAENVYKELFNKRAKVKAIHAGLECGLFLDKFPDLQMISIGPTIKGAHSPDESLEISTVEKFWDYLVVLIKSIDS